MISVARRMKTRLPWLDDLLGGGIVSGTSILLYGARGAGVSTLAQQALGTEDVLYVSGEEDHEHLVERARRVLPDAKRPVVTYIGSDLGRALREARDVAARVVVVDSLQTMKVASVTGDTGSPAQVLAVASVATGFARETGTVVVLIGHVRKDGRLAGPQEIWHVVDLTLRLWPVDSSLRRTLSVEGRTRYLDVDPLADAHLVLTDHGFDTYHEEK